MPVITLMSDFGLQNHMLASVKGKIIQSISEAQIVDISHTISGFNLQQYVYVFKQAYLHFPPGTFHFLFNDLYADTGRQLLYAYENQQHILCADNGLMTMLFHDQPAQLFRLVEKAQPYSFLSVADQYITIANSFIHHGEAGIENISADQMMIRQPSQAFYNNNTLEAQVIYIDQFGNVILNVTQKQFEEIGQGRKFKILFMRDEEITTISKHYNDVAEGDKLCLFNTASHLEIAVNKGHAAKLFGFEESNDRTLFYHSIKIFFE